MIRVVLDMNIFVSAMVQPVGSVIASGVEIRLFITGSIYAEYEEVIRRPRLQRSPEIIAGALQAIREAVGHKAAQLAS